MTFLKLENKKSDQQLGGSTCQHGGTMSFVSFFNFIILLLAFLPFVASSHRVFSSFN